MKPDCYKCKWRHNIPGSAHSKCEHPSLGKIKDDPMLNFMALFASVGREAPIAISNKTLNIRADPHSLKMGWFNFPFIFDPLWLENCDGFEKKEMKSNA